MGNANYPTCFLQQESCSSKTWFTNLLMLHHCHTEGMIAVIVNYIAGSALMRWESRLWTLEHYSSVIICLLQLCLKSIQFSRNVSHCYRRYYCTLYNVWSGPIIIQVKSVELELQVPIKATMHIIFVEDASNNNNNFKQLLETVPAMWKTGGDNLIIKIGMRTTIVAR